MLSPTETLGMYLHLARASERRRKTGVRDKMLVLAGVSAAERGLDEVAAYCRRRILANNPGHLVRQYPTLLSALEDERFLGYLKQLKRNYPQEKAEHMLDALGITVTGEREAYFTDAEYAAAILGVTAETLADAPAWRGNAAEAPAAENVLLPRPLFSAQSLPWLRRQAFVLGVAAGFSFALGAIAGAAAMFVWLTTR